MLFALNRPAPGSAPRCPWPDAGDFIYDTSGANSIYNALQVRLQQRQSHGIGFNADLHLRKIHGRCQLHRRRLAHRGAESRRTSRPSTACLRSTSATRFAPTMSTSFPSAIVTASRKKASPRRCSATGGSAATSPGATGTALHRDGAGPAAQQHRRRRRFRASRADQICNPNLPPSQRVPGLLQHRLLRAPPAGQFGDAARNTIEGPGCSPGTLQIAKWFPFGKDPQPPRGHALGDHQSHEHAATYGAFDAGGFVHVRAGD